MKQRKLLFITFVFVLLCFILPVSRYGASNIWGIIRLQASGEEIIKINEDHNYESFLVNNLQGKGYNHLKSYMKDKGWKYEEQLGSGFIFTKDQMKTIVSTQHITRYYIQIKIEKEKS